MAGLEDPPPIPYAVTRVVLRAGSRIFRRERVAQVRPNEAKRVLGGDDIVEAPPGLASSEPERRYRRDEVAAGVDETGRLIERIGLRDDVVGRVILQGCGSAKLVGPGNHAVQIIVRHRNYPAIGEENGGQVAMGIPRVARYQTPSILAGQVVPVGVPSKTVWPAHG